MKEKYKLRKLKRSPITKMDKSKKGDIVQAASIIYGEYIQYENETLIDEGPDPEQLTVKNDLYTKLSDDAKEVITTIYDAPTEFIDMCICTNNGRCRIFRGDKSYYIKKFFRKKWKSRLKVKRTFRELEKYLYKIK